MAKVAFLGLGNMGYPMAGHLCGAGHTVTVYNRSPNKVERWLAQYDGLGAATPRAAVVGAEFAFSCVGNDDDLREVLNGPQGALHGLTAGAVLVDHTTTSATVARELAQIARTRGVDFVDAPVSGGQAGAVTGALSVMCGGDTRAFERVRPVIAAYARACTLLGPVGAGQLTKMVNQICIAGVIQSLAEGLVFGQQAGLDLDTVVDVISKGAAQSWQMDNRASTMCRGEFDFGFAVDWMRKDLGIVLDEARRNGAPLPVTAMIDGFYAELQRLGRNRADTSSLIELLWNTGKK